MQDSKIDEILDKHLNDYTPLTDNRQLEMLLGNDFLKKMEETFDSDELESKIIEARGLMMTFLNEKKVDESKHAFVLYRSCLLRSFLLRPELTSDNRKLYVETFVKCMREPGKSNLSSEEEVTRKTLLWFEDYKKTVEDDDLEEAFKIANLAIVDQVYMEKLKSDLKILTHKMY